MKSTTNVFIAIRNVGDSSDVGKLHEASLSQAILWMATELAGISMAGRICVGIGRNQADALKGINIKSMGMNALNEDMKGLLESVFNDELSGDEATEQAAKFGAGSGERVAGDDYVA